MNPAMRVVVLLREPVARAYSSHQYMRARGLEPVEDFLAAVELEERRKSDGWHHLWHYTSMSRYAEAVRALQAALPREQVGIWFHDDLDADYEGTVSEILRFLGAPALAGEASGVPRVNISGKPRSAALHGAIGWAAGNERIRGFVKQHVVPLPRAGPSGVLRTDASSERARAELAPRFADDLGTAHAAWSTACGRRAPAGLRRRPREGEAV